ncbi:MAG: hypothetical protein MZV64_41600 [Ignavibacteriales bacterium]|nr:hypothetical protein [Ignavibacteriales bacterium]
MPNDATAFYGKAKVNFIIESELRKQLSVLKLAFQLDPSIRTEFAKEYPEIKSSKAFQKAY